DLLLLCRGGGDGLPAFLRGAQRETCVPEGGRRRACLVPGGDLLRAPGGPGFERLGEGGEGGGRRGGLLAPCGRVLFACGPAARPRGRPPPGVPRPGRRPAPCAGWAGLRAAR